MEMFDSSGRLIRKWESSGMEEGDWCCCEAQAGGPRHGQDPQRKERRLRRVVRLLALACVLLVSATLASLIAFVGVVRDHQASGSQVKDWERPRAMLTAPNGNNSNGRYLQWESETGTAFCHGGFNYSGGNLVVPEDGLYRVFLQITYKHTKLEDLTLLNTVYYYNDDYPKDTSILSSVDTVTSITDSDEQWRKSLYTSGLFKLKANGILRVTSSHPELIAPNEHEVFFGAERLPP